MRASAADLFGATGNGGVCLTRGWTAADDSGVWSVGSSSELTIPSPAPGPAWELALTLDPQMRQAVTRYRRIEIQIDGVTAATRRLGGKLCWRLALPAPATADTLTITLIDHDASGAADLGVHLSALDIVPARTAPVPPAVRPMSEFRFGWNETTEPMLGAGWGTPEDAFAWAVGGHSTLRLPLQSSGGAHFALLDMRPFHRPPAAVRQRVIVSVGGQITARLDLRERLTVAVPVPANAGQDQVDLRFDNLDAAFETADPFYHFGRPFAWALASVRLVPALPRYLPGYRPPLRGSLADGSLQANVQQLSGMPAASLAGMFEGLGSGCEVGLLQVALGLERPDLLRYAGVPQRDLVEGLLAGFAGVAPIDRMAWHIRRPEDGTWRLVEGAYGISFATPYPLDQPPPADGFRGASRRVPRMAEKLMENIAGGERIFVLRFPEIVPDGAAHAVLAALRHYGEADMVWLDQAYGGPPGSATRMENGLLRCGVTTSLDSLLSALANAFVLLRQAQRLAW